MPDLRVKMDESAGLSINTTSNGWLVHTWDPMNGGYMRDTTTALAVAETPDRLASMIREWAEKQVARRPKPVADGAKG